MSALPFTDDQRRAIETTGRSVIVTAAAGSGKTAVLAERCAHLVCTGSAGRRCEVDELLVVTFTEAAAAEMKSRILSAIRTRAAQQPTDSHLQRQAALIDTAQISTLHAFCLWMLRRWFNEASIDPTAAVLQEEEARLLRAETISELFDELYESKTALGRGSVRLVDDYGLGRDDGVAVQVLRLAEFLRSLPRPADWIAMATDAVGAGAVETVARADEELRREIQQQRERVSASASFIQASLPFAALYGQKLDEFAAELDRWAHAEDLDAVRKEVSAFKLSAGGGVRAGKNASEAETRERDLARDLFKDVQDNVLKGRLQPLARFRAAEMREGLAAVQSYVLTLCDLAVEFGERYQRTKASMDALDFSDLERGAYDLLHDEQSPDGLSAIARELHSRFAHVLVDEFQDINPLQAEILRLVSRESEPALTDNLFCVGDVKQSIYRFRLAEPELLQDRVSRADGDAPGTPACVRLQENFRSRPGLIDGINLLFERLMTREVGGVDYDETARLKPGTGHGQASSGQMQDVAAGVPSGRSDDDCGQERPARRRPLQDTSPDDTWLEDGAAEPIELHLLERQIDTLRDDDDETDQRPADPSDPAEWEVIEREACLIGQRIRELQASGMTVDGKPLRWRDIAVLLRSTKYNAQPLAAILGRMGIPIHAEAGESLLAATEVRDVLALLNVLDNPQQDIPLASVLRSGVTGSSLNEDDLVAIRCVDREIPFHEAADRYVREGRDDDLRDRLSVLYARLRRWRHEVRRRPLADVLWSIYQESGYLAYAGGLSHGHVRRANLLALHERARQFGGFLRQGLHRFLRFIDSLEQSGQDLHSPGPVGDADDVVRVMSIHASKGLEFPVVFVADLGHRFNFDDARGRIIFDRAAGIGMRVVDPQRMIEYPTVLHGRVARSIEAASRSEEMRVLYVAMTRAKQRLILVGTDRLDGLTDRREAWRQLGPGVSWPATSQAGTPLEWVIPALVQAPPGQVGWRDDAGVDGTAGARPRPDGGNPALYEVFLYSSDQIRDWHVENYTRPEENAALRAAAMLEPLPAEEPTEVAEFNPRTVLDGLDFPYPRLAACSVRAVVGASEAKRAIDPFADEHQPAGQPFYRPTFERPVIASPTDHADITPQERGTLTHRVLEAWDFVTPAARHVQHVVEAGQLSAEQIDAIGVNALAWFANTPLAERMRQAGDAYRREVTFISAEPADRFDPALQGQGDDTVLVRGIVDGVLSDEQGIEVIDFKTDAVSVADVESRAESYQMQMNLYARAVSRIWRRPVGRCSLVFLAARRIIEVPQEDSTS